MKRTLNKKEIEEIKNYKLTESRLPKIGDYAFKANDWRAEHPFVIAKIEQKEGAQMLNRTQKTKSNVYDIIAVNRENEFRKFVFSNGGFFSSRKLKENNREVKELIKQIT
tara:strand:+ start:252 stop:581 length:330 start_codon:yes stop_codon:yes gene_type:complete